MKVGIYDLYLPTLGGGEKHMGKMAELLSKDHDVEILTNKYFDLDKLSRHLNLDLSRVKLRVFPYISSDYGSNITKDYDLFINATYLSYMRGYAKKNVYLTFFPTPFDVDFNFIHKITLFLFKNISRNIYSWFLSKEEKYKDGLNPIEGVHDPKRFLMKKSTWTSGKATFKIEENLIKKGLIRLKINSGRKFTAPDTHIDISFGKKNVYTYHKLPRSKSRVFKIKIPLKNNDTMTIESNSFCPADFYASNDTRQLGVSVKNISSLSIFRKIVYFIIGFFPTYLINFPDDLSFLDTYDLILANSKYTKRWIKKLWKKDSFLFYPQVDIDSFKEKEVKEENIILSVGRFFVGHHNKKQIELVKAFKELYNLGLKDWSLYLVGGVEGKKEHFRYLDGVKRASKGYPIVIKTNVPRDELNTIYSKSEIYWHASGLGEDEQKHPERFEHFGISSVQAMAAGCIPVVIDKGGSREIVENGYNGFLFSNLKQLKEKSLKVINDTKLQNKLVKNSLKSCKKYNSENFEKRLHKIIENIFDIS